MIPEKLRRLQEISDRHQELRARCAAEPNDLDANTAYSQHVEASTSEVLEALPDLLAEIHQFQEVKTQFRELQADMKAVKDRLGMP